MERARYGVIEVPDPVYPDPELFYWTGNEDGTLNITPKAEEQILQARMQKAKVARAQAVSEIVVTTQAGHTFDGHEDAQNRMGRSVTIMSDTDMLPWVLADNTVVAVSKAELQEALRLSGLAMAAIWVLPYQ